MGSNQIGAIVCILFCVIFLIIALLFALIKEKGAMLISGFNTLSKEKRNEYDSKRMSKDMRNSLLLWSAIFFIGGALSYFFSFYFGIAAFILWLILFFTEVKSDPEKAFGKYKL